MAGVCCSEGHCCDNNRGFRGGSSEAPHVAVVSLARFMCVDVEKMSPKLLKCTDPPL